MARARKDNESLDEYHKNLKKEQAALKAKLQGHLLWPSKLFGPAKKVIIDGEMYFVDVTGKHIVRI